MGLTNKLRHLKKTNVDKLNTCIIYCIKNGYSILLTYTIHKQKTILKVPQNTWQNLNKIQDA